MAKTHERLTLQASFKVMKLLEANGKMDGQYWDYNAGWNDQRIADEVGCPLTHPMP